MKAVRGLSRLSVLNINKFNICYRDISSRLQVRHSATLLNSHFKLLAPTAVKIRSLGLGPTSKDFDDQVQGQITSPLTKLHANELVLHLNDEERKVLLYALQQYESKRIKEEYEDKLAGRRWRSKLGRPSKVPTLGDVDPTGSYCEVPEDWLKKKYAAKVPAPTTKELLHLSLANSIPFIGFGFLDNFIMIIAGDSIETGMSAYITLSTMAAAALGNTLSDVIGIGSAYYVERVASWVGLGAPKLSPAQLDMNISRQFSNLGRVLGITIGCILGMTPLLFIDEDSKPEQKNDEKKSK
ncbi:hypothetical protein HW555_009949 [Spodoptera exigua]|uniref:Transmembrane protein 65 n=1 Tax=Spodoptera exigua TaxID=7107 RepID=A0A835GC24_SPOEX|nr:hypothetical protein HW555_009949 [Spodoptera exigua]KAH9643398.1 hypothetical protein HF086_016687 [Spodoptera exigua]